ncbi:hypothetical protein D3C81_2141720 [compost metagenome]
MIEILMPLVEGENPEEKHQEALRVIASIAGAMLVARALDKPELSQQFLTSVINAWPGSL